MPPTSLEYETFEGATPHMTNGRYTADDYFELPEGEPVELLRGRLISTTPTPTPRHQIVVMRVCVLLDQCARQERGIAIHRCDVVLDAHTVAQPDVLYLRADRLDQIGDWINGPPNLLVEILSPSSAARDRVEKLDLYAAAGVPEYWIVDPETHIFEFHILDGATYRVTAKDSGVYKSRLFPEVELDLTAFWQSIEKRLPKS